MLDGISLYEGKREDTVYIVSKGQRQTFQTLMDMQREGEASDVGEGTRRVDIPCVERRGETRYESPVRRVGREKTNGSGEFHMKTEVEVEDPELWVEPETEGNRGATSRMMIPEETLPL